MKLPFKFKNKFKGTEENKSANINKNAYKIIVKRFMAKGVPQIIAEFEAIQDKTRDLNLVLKNVDFDFKEDINIKQSDIVSDIEYRLNLLKLPHDEQLAAINKKIETQEKRVKNIKDGYLEIEEDGEKKSIQVNNLNEKRLLKNYKVVKYCIENQGEGSYVEINKDGLKQISYLYDDGILKPIFHVAKDDSINLYANEGANRKRFYSEQYLIDKEFQEDTNGLLGSKLDKILKFALVIILALEIFAGVQLMTGYKTYHKQVDSAFMNEMRSKAEGSAIDCAWYYSQVMQSNGEVIRKFNDEMLNKTKANTNTGPTEPGGVIGLSNKLLAMS